MAHMVLAAVQTGDRRIELREFPRPAIGADDALLRVEACGLCGSDVEQFHGALVSLGLRYPTVPGHEPLGTIEEIGDVAARRWGVQPGDRVAVEPLIPCGACSACLSGRYTSCSGRPLTERLYSCIPTDHAPALWGGYAQYLYLHPNTLVHKVSNDVPAELAVMFNPLGAGVRWASHVPGTRLGDTVVIFGAGQRGVSCTIAAKAVGAGTVIVSDIAAARHKLELARVFGADATIVADEEPVVDRVRELTRDQLADVVIDVSAYATKPVVDAIDVVKTGGTVVLAGLKGPKEVPGFLNDKVVMKAITIKGVFGVDRPAYAQAIRIIESGRFPLERLHTHDFPLEQAARALETLAGEVPGEAAAHVTIRPWA